MFLKFIFIYFKIKTSGCLQQRNVTGEELEKKIWGFFTLFRLIPPRRHHHNVLHHFLSIKILWLQRWTVDENPTTHRTVTEAKVCHQVVHCSPPSWDHLVGQLNSHQVEASHLCTVGWWLPIFYESWNFNFCMLSGCSKEHYYFCRHNYLRFTVSIYKGKTWNNWGGKHF